LKILFLVHPEHPLNYIILCITHCSSFTFTEGRRRLSEDEIQSKQ